MKKQRSSCWLIFLFVTVFLLSSCGGQTQQTAQPDYKSVKTMVLDILHTEDAKKALADMMKDEKFKQNLALDQETIRTSLIQSISKPDNPHIKEAFKDPRFAGTLAKSMKDEHKKLMKELMKDPEYQKMMMDILKDPEFEKQMMDLMKSAAYRKQTMQIMKEALQSPLFQEEMLKLMTKATEEMMKPKKEEKGNQQESGDGGGQLMSQ
ncbi:MAG: spore gernimation protein [Brevibacillus sp.]|nr:spore gernimation protein [Brevibacillus sp.]